MTPEHLTNVLRKAGALGELGAVADVAVELADHLDLQHRAAPSHLHRGPRPCGLDALWQDYRLSVLWQIATPVWPAAHKLGPWIWRNNLEHVMLAVDDLGCRELLM